MANYLTTDTELTSIADAIRTKGGTQADLVYPTGFVSAINDIPTGGGSKPDIVLTGDQRFRFFSSSGTALLNAANYSTIDISNLQDMFASNAIISIPFVVNITANMNNINTDSIFEDCVNLESLPQIN